MKFFFKAAKRFKESVIDDPAGPLHYISCCGGEALTQLRVFSYLSGERGGDRGHPVGLQLLPGDGLRSGLPGHPAFAQAAAR